jgi:ABC-type spermidine/putrescine transport system permease subunit II
MDDLVGFAFAVCILVVVGYVATKRKDAELVAAGEQLAAPEWARWLLILLVAVGAPFIVGAILLTLAEVAP